MNFATAWLVRKDKRIAQARGRRGQDTSRIPEKTFMLLALMGGGLGGFIAMQSVRHKTRKWRFMIPYILATLAGAAMMAVWAGLL